MSLLLWSVEFQKRNKSKCSVHRLVGILAINSFFQGEWHWSYWNYSTMHVYEENLESLSTRIGGWFVVKPKGLHITSRELRKCGHTIHWNNFQDEVYLGTREFISEHVQFNLLVKHLYVGYEDIDLRFRNKFEARIINFWVMIVKR